jgi:hypothetical protein
MKKGAFPYYIKRIRGLPLSTIASLGLRKIGGRAKYYLKRTEVFLLPRRYSDKSFYRALKIDGSSEDVARHFLGRERPYFFWSEKELAEIIERIRNIFPNSIENTIAEANRICKHKFDLLGSGEKDLGENINWHQDFKSGFAWKRKFYMDIEKIIFDNNSDIKVPWELSRFQHLSVLGKAHLYTQDEKYVMEFVSQVSSWIDENPPMIGANWVNAMEVSIRAINMIAAFYLFRRSQVLTSEFCCKFMKSLLEHGRFIIRNLEIRQVIVEGKVARLNGNHYMADIVGLVFLGLLFPEFKDSENWKRLAIPELFKETLSQNNPDGVNYELSIGYHRFVTELCLSAIILCMKNGIEIPADVLGRLKRMVEFTGSYTKPDGSSPLLGDADDGRLFKLSANDINDHRYLLGVGSILFKREDFKALAGGFNEGALWLLGPKGYRDFKSIPTIKYIPKSESYEVSGFYVLRKKDLYMIITCNDNGVSGTGGSHAHNDCLSFELFAFDQTFITDSGTYAYTENLEKRNRFRGTKAHNTIMIDGEEINRIPEGEAFRLENDARPIVKKWLSNDDFDFFEGLHFGYKRLINPATHRRRIFFDKLNECWVVKDILEGKGRHIIDSFYHLSPETKLKESDGSKILLERNGKRLLLYFMDHNKNLEVIDDFVSFRYGKMVKARTIRLRSEYDLPLSLSLIILPFRGLRVSDWANCKKHFERFEQEIVGSEVDMTTANNPIRQASGTA